MTVYSPEQKSAIIIAAVTSAGPGADDAAVGEQVGRILRLLEEGSTAHSAFHRAEQRAERTTDIKQFVGTIIHVDIETTSNRPIVFLKTEPSAHHPEGIESVRLDRLDSAESTAVRDLARQAQALRGHEVLVAVAVEKGAGKNVRVLRSITDRRVNANYEANNPTFQVPWHVKSFADLTGKLASFRPAA